MITCSIPDSSAVLLRQWVAICKDYQEQFPKDDGHWPRGTGELVEEALELWVAKMKDLEDRLDPVGSNTFAEQVAPKYARELYLRRYVTGNYFDLVEKLDLNPVGDDE